MEKNDVVVLASLTNKNNLTLAISCGFINFFTHADIAENPKLKTRIGANGNFRFSFRVPTYSFGSLNWMHEAFFPDGKRKKSLKILVV